MHFLIILLIIFGLNLPCFIILLAKWIIILLTTINTFFLIKTCLLLKIQILFDSQVLMLILQLILLNLICKLAWISWILLIICSKTDRMITRIFRRQILILSIKINTQGVCSLCNFKFLLFLLNFILSLSITTTA